MTKMTYPDEEAFHILFNTLDEAEEKLSKRRFFGGDQPNGKKPLVCVELCF